MKQKPLFKRLAQAALSALAIFAGGAAWAATPVAEWGPGDFPVSAAGSYDNLTATSGSYTISKNNGYNISTADYIQVAPSSVGGGWPIVISSTDLAALTVVVAFSLDEDASGSLVGLTTGRGANRFYAYLEDGAMYAGYNNGGSDKYGDLSTTAPTDGTIHYLVFAYGKTAGTQMFYDGVSKYNASGLREGDYGGNSGSISEITFGAQRGPQQIINGAKFHYVAVYDSKLGDADAYSAYLSAFGAVNGMVPATPSADGNNDCTFTITEDSYYYTSSATTYNSITFDVATGKKLVLYGSTLTGTNGITVTGDGVVEVSSASALSGALSGDGTVAYVGVTPSGVSYSASWTGTIWIKNVTGNAHRNFNDWGREGSKVKVSGVSGYLDAQITYTPEVVLDDDTYGFALKLQNGNSPQNNDSNKNRCAIFKKLSGSGTLTAGGDTWTAWPVVKLYDISGFTGNIDCGSSGTGLIALICNENEELADTLYNLFNSKTRCIYVSAGRTGANAVSIPSGATWSAANGIYVVSGGTLNLAGGTLCNTLYGSATVTAASSASSLTIADGSTLTVNAALSGSVTVASGGTVDVAAASSAAFTVASGGTLNAGADITGAVSVTGVCNTIGNVSLSSSANAINQAGVLNVYPALGSTGTTSFNAGGQDIKGTVNIEANATLKSLGGDLLWYDADSAGGIVNVKASGTLDMDVKRWTMGPYNQINLYEGATVTGTGDGYGAIDMNKWSSSDVVIHAYGNATIEAPIRSVSHTCGVFDVDSGKTLTFSGRLFDNKTTKRGLGTLKLTYANGNAGTTTGAAGDSYKIPTLEAGVIEFAGAGAWTPDIGEVRDLSGYAYSGTGSIAFSAKQTGAECALGSDIVFENVASASFVPTVTLRNGGTVTPVLGGTTATYTGSGTISIDGGATDLDLTCTNTIDFAYASFTGASTWRDVAPVYTEDGVYARARVYTDGTGTFLANNSAALTLAVVGQMSSTTNTIFLTLGNSYSSGTGSGLVIARTSEPDEVTIGYNEGRVVHKITNMTVPNCATSRHAYIITKQDGETTTTFTVYLDGIKWKTLSIAKLTLTGGGVQIGADFGGGIRNVEQSEYDNKSFITIPNSESETGVLNVMRMYGRVITPAEIAQYATTYPYVSPNGSSTRLFATGAENWIDTTESSEVWINSTGGNSGTPTVGANVTVVAQTDTVITVNLASTTEYEGLTVNDNSAKFVPASASSGAVRITGMTVIGTVVTNAYGAVDMSGGPMTITEDGSICFDMSGYDASAVYTTTDIDLTGDVDEAPAKVSLISPVTPYRTYSLVYTDDHYVMHVVPNHEAGASVYYVSGEFSASSADLAVELSDGTATAVFPGDNVVFDDAHATDTTVTFGSTTPTGATFSFVDWTGTVVLPAITTGEVNLNNYGAAGSTVRLAGGMSGGWLSDAVIAPTIDIPSGQTMTLAAFSPSFANTINTLTGAGTFSITATANEGNGLDNVENWDTEGYSAYFLLKDISGFTGSLSTATPGIAIGSTKPAINTVGSAILVSSGVTATIGTSATWTAPNINVDGVLSTTDNARWSGTIVVSDNGVMELTNTSTKSEELADYSSITGTGTLRYTAANTSHWRTLPNTAAKRPATTLTLENNVAGGLIVTESNNSTVPVTEIGSLKGTGKLRSDWTAQGADSRSVRINQAKNTTWNGTFHNDRFQTFYVTGGGTLTWNDATEYSDFSIGLEVENTGSVNVTGKWCVGAVTVDAGGTFGGVGTVTSVTFANGSTFKVFETSGYGTGTAYLKATGGVMVASGNVVWVETEQTPYEDMVLMDFGANAAPAGTFRFANETYRSSWVPKVVGNQLVVAAHTSETINVASGSEDFADSYFDCTVTKTGAGEARLTGALDNVTLDVQAGTLNLACSSASGLTITGAGTLKLSMNIDLTGATFTSFTGSIDIAYGVRVTVTSDMLAQIDTTNYNVVANKDGTYTISVKPRDSVIDFVANDSGITLSVPEDGVGGTVYHTKYGKVTGVEIGTTPIEVQNLGLNDRLAPFTIALDVTMPETMPTGYDDADAPILISWVIGSRERYNLFLKSDGTLQTSAVGATATANGSARNAKNSLDASNTTVLEAGNTYHIEMRYWGVEANVDTGNPQVARSYSSANTGTSIWLDGVKIIADSGLRCGSLRNETDAEHTNFASSLTIGASAYDKTSSLFAGLTVNAVGFLNERMVMGNNLKEVNTVGSSALPSIQSSDATAGYLYSYGVMANGVTGGYSLTEQTTVLNSPIGGNSASNTWNTLGVVMTHSSGGATKVTLSMSVDIPEGSAGGTICEIPVGSETIVLKYNGSTDKFGVGYSAAEYWQPSAAGDGAHVLVLTYDSSAGIYLWVDSYDENNTHSNTDVAMPASIGAALGDTICFGAKSDATEFFAGLGVIYQNVQFGMAVCTEEDVEQALEAFDFAPELAVLPLSERLKCLPLVAESNNGGSVPLPEISISGQVLTGFAAQAAMRNLGIYTNCAVNLSFTAFNHSSGVMTCSVSPEFFVNGSVSLVGSKNDGRTWDRLEVATPTDSGTVEFNLGAHAFDNGDYTRFKIVQEYTNGVALTTGTIHNLLANTPKTDGLFKYGDAGTRPECYRIPAIASSYVPDVSAVGITEPDEAAIMALFDARFSYNDLGVPMNAAGTGLSNHNNASVDHYTGIDQAGVFSLDGAETWSYPQIMIDVPNASDPKTNVKTTSLTKAMELGDPCIVYDYANQKFLMMGITGGGIFKPYDDGADLVMYECSLSSVQSASPSWVKVGSVLNAITNALATAAGGRVSFTPVRGTAEADDAAGKVYGKGYCGILQCPGHAFVTRRAVTGIPAGTVIWPMQYIKSGDSEHLPGLFAAWQDSEGAWHATSPVTDSNYNAEEGSIVELDDGSWLYMGKDAKNTNASIVRPFYLSTDHATWTSAGTLPQSVRVQGSMIRLGTHTDGFSRYAAVFCTGDDTSRETFVRKNLRVFIGTDSGSGSVSWNSTAFATVWAGDTGYTNDGNVSFGYNSLVMLNPTTLGVLFEANGHIYFTKVDVSSALE